MSERQRLFVAVPLGDELGERLRHAVAAWQGIAGADALRWTDPASWHVTLAFLGWVDAERRPGIVTATTAVAEGHAPMRRRTGGLGAFPRPAHARVLWYGIDDADGRMGALAADLRHSLGVEGSALRPHVTLGRALGRGEVDLRALIAEARAPAGELVVDRLRLMQSHLGSGPARYETLATMRLEGRTDG